MTLDPYHIVEGEGLGIGLGDTFGDGLGEGEIDGEGYKEIGTVGIPETRGDIMGLGDIEATPNIDGETVGLLYGGVRSILGRSGTLIVSPPNLSSSAIFLIATCCLGV